MRSRWSPEQIALTLGQTYPKGHELRVSHQTVYNCIPQSVAKRQQRKHEWPVSPELPKGADLSGYSQDQLDAIADEINNRPRKGLGVRSPLSVYRELLVDTPQHSTLIH
jgi:IS30 family transposase